LFQVTDGTPDGWSNGVSRVVQVKPVNDAPTLTVPAVGPAGPPNTNLAVNGIGAADVAAGDGVVRLTLRVAYGTIWLLNTYGLTVVGAAYGTGRVVVEGTLDRLNATMTDDNLVYQPAAGFEGIGTLIITLDDRGLNGSGGAGRSRGPSRFGWADPPLPTRPRWSSGWR
jgi:large repetitive protein